MISFPHCKNLSQKRVLFLFGYFFIDERALTAQSSTNGIGDIDSSFVILGKCLTTIPEGSRRKRVETAGTFYITPKK
jgi:hypothetical protein